MKSPFSLGVNSDFTLSDEDQKALEALPPDEKEHAERTLKAIKSGDITPEQLPALAQQGQAALSPAAAPAAGTSPYGLPGVPQAGPPTEAQAAAGMSGPPPIMQQGPGLAPPLDPMNAQLAVQAKQQTDNNQQAFLAQYPSFGGIQVPGATPVPARSGLSNHNQLVQDMLSRASDTRPQGMSPEEIKAQAEAISNIPIVKQAQEGLSQQENLLKMQQEPKSFWETANWGPAMAFFDSKRGSNMAGAYKAPETAAAEQKRIMDALQKIQTDRQALAGNVVSGIKASKGGMEGNVIAQDGKLTQFSGAVDPLNNRTTASMARLLMNGTAADMKELNSANAATQEAQRMLASGSSILDTTFRDKFLKAMIGGRVTNYDLMRQSGDTALADRAEQIMNTMTSGTFSPKNRAEYQDALRIIQEANQHEAAARITDLRRVGTVGLGLPEDQVEGILSVGHLGNFSSVPDSVLQQSKAKSERAVPDLYDGSHKLSHPTPEQKKIRLQYLQQKAGG